MAISMDEITSTSLIPGKSTELDNYSTFMYLYIIQSELYKAVEFQLNLSECIGCDS